MKSLFVFVSSLLFSTTVLAAMGSSSRSNLIAIGQGISSPTSTSTVNFTTGYTHENPIGVVYQNSWRLTGEYEHDTDDNGTDGFGGDHQPLK